jgi:hypothetical protein
MKKFIYENKMKIAIRVKPGTFQEKMFFQGMTYMPEHS